ncbi:cytochrome C oxidase subunit IV family protein [Ureibacillus sp. FSL K6-8385]|uniref:Cytochrome B6 n=1 Tax=Ureibacillus terrenus TaxID=118246 RepID=A0A540V436_9BACL|nr:cytochrome C oxidase subunit IV family protein [Ureibacillus terrenus]MED3660283.1 cytochrome C oxidase subunit IV family protein [Ureibacillus terrenus]MED3764971.1 cytochrome C oxidase subunit IV family protein [Ureibacillus terrenus]TQE91512.1 cytochrome B6 [Ureibacillus terrenus]
MSHDTEIQGRSQAEYEFGRRKSAEKMRKQVINFAIMIFLTFIAFATVVADFAPTFIKPIILLLAGIQVVLQLYSFMHMDEKEAPYIGVISTFVWVGAIIAFTFFLAFNTIIWW